MTITVVQTANFNGTWSGSFGSNVTAGNTVFLFGFQYGSSGGMSSSSPLFNGSSVSGAVKLFDGQNTGGSDVYATIWMLPNVTGGAKSVALTNSGGSVDGNVGSAAIEVSGLGASPALDSGSPDPETGNGTSGTVASGSTGALAASAAIILAAGVQYGSDPGAQGSPWTDLQPSSFCRAVWQVVTSSGGTYAFSGNTDGVPGWFAGVAAVAPGGGSTPVTGSDTGSGADSGSVAASVPGSDTGSGADSGKIGVTGTDAGSGADTGSVLLGASGSDTGAGTDSGSVAASLSGADTGSGADSGSVGVSGSDAGSGADAGSVAVNAADAASGADTGSVAASVSGSDSGSGAENGSVPGGSVPVSDSDTGSAAESGSVTPLAPAKPQGGWYQLLSIIQDARQSREFYDAAQPMACPRDGEPFENAPTADSGSDVELYCRFCGFHYPRDWDAQTMSGF